MQIVKLLMVVNRQWEGTRPTGQTGHEAWRGSKELPRGEALLILLYHEYYNVFIQTTTDTVM